MFRGAELLRLLTGLVMMAVLLMLFHRFRDPNMWTWLAPDNSSAKPSDKTEGTRSPPRREPQDGQTMQPEQHAMASDKEEKSRGRNRPRHTTPPTAPPIKTPTRNRKPRWSFRP